MCRCLVYKLGNYDTLYTHSLQFAPVTVCKWCKSLQTQTILAVKLVEVDPWHACTATVTVLGSLCVSVCVSICLHIPIELILSSEDAIGFSLTLRRGLLQPISLQMPHSRVMAPLILLLRDISHFST